MKSRRLNSRIRKLREKEFGQLYSLHRYNFGKCFYCDEPASGFDHVPSLACMDWYTPEKLRSLGYPFVRVECCIDCNRALGSKKLLSTLERTSFLYEHLTKVYEKSFSIWLDEELEELGYSLRMMIKGKKKVQYFIQKRLKQIEITLLTPEKHPERIERIGDE